VRLPLQQRDLCRAKEIFMGSLARVIRVSLTTGVASMALLATGASGQSSSEPAAATGHQPEVVITGQRAEYATRISLFVSQLTEFDLGDPSRGLARWIDPVCPLVTGLSKQSGEYILGRVSEIAQAAGAPLGGEKCHPNLFIIVTNQPEADLRDLEKRHLADVFGGAEPSVIDGFIALHRPVKTWYDTVQKTPEGLPLLIESFPGVSQQSAKATPGGLEIFPVRPNVSDAATTNPWSQASHLVLNAVWVIQRAFVIVDPTQFKGVTRAQLADYVALSGLAQIRLDTHLAADDPTILTLFDRAPQAASPGLTQWDQAFLKSVYATEPKSVLQRSNIASDMVRQIVP
jgi:hypothetical protein